MINNSFQSTVVFIATKVILKQSHESMLAWALGIYPVAYLDLKYSNICGLVVMINNKKYSPSPG